jgi:hypothetical protein
MHYINHLHKHIVDPVLECLLRHLHYSEKSCIKFDNKKALIIYNFISFFLKIEI